MRELCRYNPPILNVMSAQACARLRASARWRRNVAIEPETKRTRDSTERMTPPNSQTPVDDPRLITQPHAMWWLTVPRTPSPRIGKPLPIPSGRAKRPHCSEKGSLSFGS